MSQSGAPGATLAYNIDMSFQTDFFGYPLSLLLICGLSSGCNGGEDGTDTDSGTTTTSPTETSETGETTQTGETTMTSETSGSETGTETGTETTAGPVGACDPDAPIDLEVSADITTDTTWQGTVRIAGDIDIYDGATLTILPGTAIVVETGRSLEFGWNSDDATVIAQGTAEQPIEFCGSSDDPGAWDGIDIRQNVTSDSVFEYVTIRNAGDGRAALVLYTGISLRNVSVIGSGEVGVSAVDFADDSEQLTVTGALDVPVLITGEGAITHLPLGGAYTDNLDDVIAIDVADIVSDTHYRDPGVPYRQERVLDVYDEAEFTIDAGVVYQMAVDTDIEFGWNSGAATVMINGTAESPVIFEGEFADAGYWEGLIFRGNVTSNSRISYTVVRDGGGAGPVMSIRAPITLDHVTLNDNFDGVYVDEQGLGTDSTALTINGTMGAPLRVEPNATVSIPTGGDYSGNDRDEIVIEGGDFTISGTIPNVGVPYYVDGSLDIYESAEMTIEAGVNMIMGPDTDFEFGWNSQEATLIAVGTAEQPIVFRGRDPVAGWWRGIRINGNVLSNSQLDYVEIGHGGQNDGANLYTRRPLNVTNSHFHDSAAYGILKESDDSTDYLGPNTFSNNPSGDVGDI